MKKKEENCFFFLKEKISPFENNCQKGFVVQTDYVFEIKFCIKISKKPPSCFLVSYNFLYISFYIVSKYHFSLLFRTCSFNIIVKNIFGKNFPFLITDSLKPIYPHNNSQNLLSMMNFFVGTC